MTLDINSQKFSARAYSRIGGIIYLVIIVAGFFGEMVVRNVLIAPGNAAETAANILAHPLLWRIGIAGDLLMQTCDVPLIIIFYVLLKPVNKNLAQMNLVFNVVQTAVLVANKLSLLMPLFLLDDAEYLKTFDPGQLQTLSYLFIKLHNYGFGVGLIFFGFVCLIEGHLIAKSTFMPAILGRMLQLAGVCYLFNSFSSVLYPEITNIILMLPCLVAELSLALWMVAKGVDDAQWKVAASKS